MKVLLFGSEGQLGFELLRRFREQSIDFSAPGWREVDITKAELVLETAELYQPELIINAAAYTAVDRAESESEVAFAVNCDGAAHIAEAARQCGARLIHVSTDYVFDGRSKEAVTEEAPVTPLGVYGRSKAASEEAVQRILPQSALIARTASLHGQGGPNFVHTMVRLMLSREKVRVVADQYMSPTWAGWLAEILLELGGKGATGLLHTCGAGAVTWFEFAQEIKWQLEPQQVAAGRVMLEPITAAEFAAAAPRPQYSVLSTGRLESLLGRPALDWREGLARHLAEIDFGRKLAAPQ